MLSPASDTHGHSLSDAYGASGRLTQVELATFWQISPRTLERWRSQGTGPAWLRIGGRVLYRMTDVLAFEQAHRRDASD